MRKVNKEKLFTFVILAALAIPVSLALGKDYVYVLGSFCIGSLLASIFIDYR